MKPTSSKQNPYCAFRDDKERRVALISRDIRIVIIATLAMIGSSQVSSLIAAFSNW